MSLRRVVWSIELLGFFLKELLIANLQVVVAVIKPNRYLKPAIVRVPLALESETAMVLLANMITLTPGTLSLDLLPSERLLIVHVLHTHSPEQTVAKIKWGFEARLLRLFSKGARR